MDNQQKYKVISLLQNDTAPRDIADDLDISYGAVLKLRREYDDAKLNGTIDQLVNMDNVILSEVADKLSELPGAEKASPSSVPSGSTSLPSLSLVDAVMISFTRLS